VRQTAMGRLAGREARVAAGAFAVTVGDQLLPTVHAVEAAAGPWFPVTLAARSPCDLDAVLDDVLDHVERAFEDVADQCRDGPSPAERLPLEGILELLGDKRVKPSLVSMPSHVSRMYHAVIHRQAPLGQTPRKLRRAPDSSRGRSKCTMWPAPGI